MPKQEELFNPPQVGGVEDYERERYDALNNGEIFWLSTDRTEDNHALRKLDDNEALDTKTQGVVTIKYNQVVFYKT
jgi:hypothetical protein